MMSARRCGPLGLADQLEMWMALDRQQLWQRFEGSQHLLPPTRPFRTPSADHFIHHVAVIFKNPENLIRLAEFEIKWCLIMWIIFDHHVISTLKRINFSFAGIETLFDISCTTNHSLLYLRRQCFNVDRLILSMSTRLWRSGVTQCFLCAMNVIGATPVTRCSVQVIAYCSSSSILCHCSVS